MNLGYKDSHVSFIFHTKLSDLPNEQEGHYFFPEAFSTRALDLAKNLGNLSSVERSGPPKQWTSQLTLALFLADTSLPHI